MDVSLDEDIVEGLLFLRILRLKLSILCGYLYLSWLIHLLKQGCVELIHVVVAQILRYQLIYWDLAFTIQQGLLSHIQINLTLFFILILGLSQGAALGQAAALRRWSTCTKLI